MTNGIRFSSSWKGLYFPWAWNARATCGGSTTLELQVYKFSPRASQVHEPCREVESSMSTILPLSKNGNRYSMETSFVNHLKFVFSFSFRTIKSISRLYRRCIYIGQERLDSGFSSFPLVQSLLISVSHSQMEIVSRLLIPREILLIRAGQHNRRESGKNMEDRKFTSSSIICPVWNVYRSFHCPPFHPPLWQDSHYIVFTGVGRISKEACPYPRLVPLLSNPTIYKPTYAPTIYAPMHFIPSLRRRSDRARSRSGNLPSDIPRCIVFRT